MNRLTASKLVLTSALLAASSVLGASAADAAKLAEIRQIDTAKHMAVVQTHGANIRSGDMLIATAKNSTQCSLRVRSVNGNIATVDTGNCSFANQLRVGQTVEPSLLNDTASAPSSLRSNSPSASSSPSSESTSRDSMGKIAEVTPASELIGITVFGFYDMADKVKGDISTQGQSIAATENSETAFGVGAEYAQYNYHFIGFYGNGAYEFGRDWKSLDARGGTETNDPKPTLTMFLVGGGGNFLITDNFYAKAGVNYNFPSLTSGGGITDIGGKLGFEGGAGVRFARQVNAEIIYRKINMTASGKNFSVDNLSTSGFLLRAGYVF